MSSCLCFGCCGKMWWESSHRKSRTEEGEESWKQKAKERTHAGRAAAATAGEEGKEKPAERKFTFSEPIFQRLVREIELNLLDF